MKLRFFRLIPHHALLIRRTLIFETCENKFYWTSINLNSARTNSRPVASRRSKCVGAHMKQEALYRLNYIFGCVFCLKFRAFLKNSALSHFLLNFTILAIFMRSGNPFGFTKRVLHTEITAAMMLRSPSVSNIFSVKESKLSRKKIWRLQNMLIARRQKYIKTKSESAA